MNTLLLERPTQQATLADIPSDFTTAEGVLSGTESDNGLTSSELPHHSDPTIKNLGDMATTIAMTDEAAGTEVRDERGNILPVHKDLREVADENPWVLERRHTFRNLGRKVLMGVVEGYRTIPPEVRGKVVRKGHSSDVSLAALAAGYGFNRGFLHYALPKGALNVFNPGEPGPWEDLLNWS